MIIYLASFPRSGNTLCRQLIKHYFDSLSTSVYDELSFAHEKLPLDADTRFQLVISETGRHYRILIQDSLTLLTSELRQQLAASPEIFFVKTHELPFESYFDGEYVIRVVRHPAAALWSYYKYLESTEEQKVTLKEVIEGWSGSLEWSHYTKAWYKAEKKAQGQLFKVKYEDLIHAEELLVAKVQDVTGLPLVNSHGTFPKLEHRNSQSPKVYRSDQVDVWKGKLAPEDIMLIYERHADAMAIEDYNFDFAPPPYSVDYETRIHLAKLGMVDVVSMPKVADAGQIVESGNLRYQVMFNGVKVLADSYYGPWYTDLIQQCRGHHEPQEEYVFDQIVNNAPEGAKMMELGSFWAFYSTWFLTHVKNSHAILVEPLPDNIVTSIATLSLNRCKCRANLELGAIGICDPMFQNIYIGGSQRPNYEIPLLSVDGLMESYSIEHLYILHSDIQGAEAKMLEGAAHALENQKIDYILVSTHSEEIHNTCLQMCEAFNYHIIAEHDIYESYTYDGLIVAQSDRVQGFDKLTIHRRTAAEWSWETAKKAWEAKDTYLEKHRESLPSSELRPALNRLREEYNQLLEQNKSLEQERSQLRQELDVSQQALNGLQQELSQLQQGNADLEEELAQLQETVRIRELDYQARAQQMYHLAKQVEHFEKTITELRNRKITKIMRRLGKPLI